MADIWEKAISILTENLNSDRSYLITAVLQGQLCGVQSAVYYNWSSSIQLPID